MRLKKDTKSKILELHRGKFAVQKIKSLFFGNDYKKASKWASKWNNYEKSQAIFIIYSYQYRVNKVIIFKFIIGDIKTGSALGERHTFLQGKEIMKNI